MIDSTVNNIRQRLSLRKPLAEALELTAQITSRLALAKSPQEEAELEEFLKAELAKVREVAPAIKDFERDFPSLAFSIATGVGKTRLMGAIIAYLNLKHRVKHFFILAPNLTLYEKLKRDFGDTSYEKYVFKGISEFVAMPPKVITGENYDQQRFDVFGRGIFSPVEINIFNIAKFNIDSKDSRRGTARMRRLSETIGQSYFDYLASLPDLVVLMDEAHRYHADASKKAINELRPMLGFEMTATPIDEKGRPFKNIVYEYNLAQALADGLYVKEPTIVTRKNFNKAEHTPEEVEIAMIEDGINVHERTKTQIELYARQTGQRVVKPFILMACRNIAHATEVKELLESDRIYHGRYRGKVLQIDSSTKKEEEIEQQFVGLEAPDNEIEIVVHVDMLKEGWDVSNLYTIIPLRAADAVKLVEQTIGRGLRLPYGGQRTGNADVDRLTVVAHDNFTRIIEEAKKGSSVLRRLSFVELDEEQLDEERGTVIRTATAVEERVQRRIAELEEKHQIERSQHTNTAVEAVVDAINMVSDSVATYTRLTDPAVKQQILEKAAEQIRSSATGLFAEAEAEEQIARIEQVLDVTIEAYRDNVIEIPRAVIMQPEVITYFDDFDLQTEHWRAFPPVTYEMIRQSLVSDEVETIEGKTGSSVGNPLKILTSAMIDYDEIDYDDNADLLNKLAHQAAEAVLARSPEVKDKDELATKIYVYRNRIKEDIYEQMKQHFHIEKGEARVQQVRPHDKIRDQHLVQNSYGTRAFTDTVSPLSWVKKYIFKGYQKSYYTAYRFDSSTELDFAFVLENDAKVKKWLRPVPEQFNIYWDHGSRKYEPDFIVETDEAIYMCETKSSKELGSTEVEAKAQAAAQYCRMASDFTRTQGGKPWRYVILPHDKVRRNSSFHFLLGEGKRYD